MTHKRHRLNVVGSYYVEDGCCTRCGLPHSIAPELFGEANDSCFVKRQPQSASDVDKMLRAMITADLGCIRYGGEDPMIIRRLAESGEGTLADIPPPTDILPSKRDHVGLIASPQLTPQVLADAFVAHLQTLPAPQRFKARVVQTNVDRCELAVAWFEDKFHPITFQRSSVPEYPWLIVGLESIVYDWLSDRALGQAVFFHARDWYSSRRDGSTVAW